MKNCEVAKDAPATRTAGQISNIAANPTKAQINQNGTNKEKNGRMRPAMAPSVISLNPVTAANAMMGVPRAPYATGAVLAINDNPDACRGLNPKPINNAAVTAT